MWQARAHTLTLFPSATPLRNSAAPSRLSKRAIVERHTRLNSSRSDKAVPGRPKEALAVAWLGSLLLSQPVFDRLFKRPYVIIGIRQHALSAIRDDRCPANLDSIHDVHRAID